MFISMTKKGLPPPHGQQPARWLLLVHQLPPKPAYIRVKVWRRLQGLGAIALKNSVYVLPASEQAQEDFQWLLQEIRRDGGDGMVCEAEIVDGTRDDEIRAQFDRARDSDYTQLAKSLRELKAARRKRGADIDLPLAKIKQRFEVVSEHDFFGASGRLGVAALLAELDNSTSEEPPKNGAAAALSKVSAATWVTRRGVQVDRIASAWLIRRFIDPKASFKFVDEKRHSHQPGELRFDMFQAEYTHVGDRCTFEVLVRLLPRSDPALRAISEIVHDIDLKDHKFDRKETAGFAHVLEGICAAHADDMVRIARGNAVLDDTYERFLKRR